MNINAAVSKPCFELWEILHYKTAEELDLKAILENHKISNNKRYIKKLLLQTLLDVKGHTSEGSYILKTETAIQNSLSKLLRNSNEDLYDNVGTSMNKLLKVVLEIT